MNPETLHARITEVQKQKIYRLQWVACVLAAAVVVQTLAIAFLLVK